MNLEEAKAKLKSIRQEHLLKFWDTLSSSNQAELLREIDQIDIKTFQAQQELLKHPSSIEIQKIEPYKDYTHSGNKDDFLLGKKRMAQGKVGCLIVAGGQGTRLRFEGPKGMFPVTRIKHKCLLQLFAEKVLAASKQANYPLPLAIMTSPINDETIKDFFAQNNCFGLLPEQIFFYSQKELPFLDSDGNMFLETTHSLSKGPDGNGNSLRYFYESGIWQQWDDLGVDQINFLQIDNPLADPFDAELVGYNHRTETEATLKCVLRKEAQEKVGVIAKVEDKTAVLEYTELPMKERSATTSEGSLKYPLANTSLFCFSMNFVRECAKLHLPFHASFKSAKTVDEKGQTQFPFDPNAWKMEAFIFDNLDYAKKVNGLLYPRKECFSPLKNAEGPDSLGVVQEALQQADIEVVKKISKCDPPKTPFELSQDFYYPTPYLLSIWEERPFPNKPYITEGS